MPAHVTTNLRSPVVGKSCRSGPHSSVSPGLHSLAWGQACRVLFPQKYESQDLDERASRWPTGILSCLSKLIILTDFIGFNEWVNSPFQRWQSLGLVFHFVINLNMVKSIPTNLWMAYVLLFSERVVCFWAAFPPWCCSPGCCTGPSYSWGTVLCWKCWCRCTSKLCFACPCAAESRWTNELTSHGHISQFEWCLKKCNNKILHALFLFTIVTAEEFRSQL